MKFALIFISVFTLTMSNFSPLIIKANVTMIVTFEELSHVTSIGGITLQTKVIDDTLHVMNVASGLTTYDISDKTTPVLLDNYQDGGMAHHFFIEDNLFYLADHADGVEIYNISNPSNLSEVGQYLPEGDGEIDGLFVKDKIIYAWEWHDSTTSTKLLVINASNPESLTKISEYTDADGMFYRFVVRDDLCFTTCCQYGFKILNVSNPLSITEINHFEDMTYAFEIRLVGNTAYITDANRFIIMNISDVQNPTLIGEFTTINPILGIQVFGSHVFIAEDATGVIIVDITIPENPVAIGQFDTPDIFGVEVDNQFLYLSLVEYGFKIIQFTVITHTEEVSNPVTYVIIAVLCFVLITSRKHKQ